MSSVETQKVEFDWNMVAITVFEIAVATEHSL